ncbi:MAG: hypothetical protein M9899_05190 [Bdellovibrionaceae bacterium]|nr:hypothetical protein [Pseudobdellovibrionaceae bacterium]
MKSLLLTLILSVFSAGVFTPAAFAIDDEVPPGIKIDYVSWCEGDAIKTRDEDGQAYTEFDCYDADRRCIETTVKKNDWYVVTATCK